MIRHRKGSNRQLVRSHSCALAYTLDKPFTDWQLKWDNPVVITTGQILRWHEYVRRKEAGIYEDILPLRKFEEEFDATSPAIQKAVRESTSEAVVIQTLMCCPDRAHCLSVEIV